LRSERPCSPPTKKTTHNQQVLVDLERAQRRGHVARAAHVLSAAASSRARAAVGAAAAAEQELGIVVVELLDADARPRVERRVELHDAARGAWGHPGSQTPWSARDARVQD
jgi:hypothetical protein